MLPVAVRLSLAVCAGLLLACVTLPAETKSDLHTLIPGDAKLIAVLRPRQILDAPLGDPDRPVTLKGMLNDHVKDIRFLDVISLADINTAVVALPSVGELRKVFLALRGKFDRAAIRKMAAERFKDSFKEQGTGARALMEFTIPVDSFRGISTPAEAFLAIPDETTCLISLGNRDDLVAALAGSSKGTPVVLRQLLDKNDPDAAISYGLVNHLAGPFAEIKDIRRAFELFQGVHGMVQFKDEPTGQILVLCPTPEAAREIGEMAEKGLNGVTGALALISQANKGLTPVVNVLRTIRVRAQADQVRIRGKLERDTLEDLLRKGK